MCIRDRSNKENPSRTSSRSNSPSSGSTKPSKNNNIEEAAFSTADRGVGRSRRRPGKSSGSNNTNQRSSSKSSYCSSARKPRPRDNSSRFDD